MAAPTACSSGKLGFRRGLKEKVLPESGKADVPTAQYTEAHGLIRQVEGHAPARPCCRTPPTPRGMGLDQDGALGLGQKDRV